jgi:hypothetical protein
MMEIIDFLRKYFKVRYIFQAIFLFFSCYLLVNYLTGLVDDPAVKKGIAAFGICLDVAMQFIILARAKFNWRKGSWSKKGFIKYRVTSLLLFILYAIYVIFYAVLSAVGFFLVEVDKKEATIAEMKTTQSDNQQRLQEIADEIKALNLQLVTESKTGYGSNSKAIIARKDNLIAERERIKSSNRESLTVQEKVYQSAANSFHTLSSNMGIPSNILKLMVFGISVIMLYVFIILTSWEIEEIHAVVSETVNETVNKTVNETDVETVGLAETQNRVETVNATETHETPKTIETYETKHQTEKICPVCLSKFSSKRFDAIYCSSKCRLIAFRTKSLKGVV